MEAVNQHITLGSLYGKGEFIPQDKSKAVYFLAVGLEDGSRTSQNGYLIIFAHAHPGEKVLMLRWMKQMLLLEKSTICASFISAFKTRN